MERLSCSVSRNVLGFGVTPSSIACLCDSGQVSLPLWVSASMFIRWENNAHPRGLLIEWNKMKYKFLAQSQHIVGSRQYYPPPFLDSLGGELFPTTEISSDFSLKTVTPIDCFRDRLEAERRIHLGGCFAGLELFMLDFNSFSFRALHSHYQEPWAITCGSTIWTPLRRLNSELSELL